MRIGNHELWWLHWPDDFVGAEKDSEKYPAGRSRFPHLIGTIIIDFPLNVSHQSN
jgi:hypothetical protein